MSDTSAQQQEPSMEEILASIRRIISEDSEEGEGVSEQAETEESEADVESRAAPEEDTEDVLELTEVVADEPEFEPEPEEPPAADEELFDDGSEVEEAPAIIAGDDSEGIVSEEPATLAANAIAGMMSQIQSSTRLGSGDATIEQIVKELLRPLLKEWLDANLPDLVERVVREEIQRVAAKSR